MSCTHRTERFGPVMNEQQTHKTPREPEFVNNVEIQASPLNRIC